MKTLLLLLMMSLASCCSRAYLSECAADSRYLSKTFKNKNRWLIDGQIDSLKQIIHPNVIYAHSNGWVQDYNDITAQWTSPEVSYDSIIVDTLDIQIIDKVGVVSGRARFFGIYKQKSFQVKLYFLENYLCQGNKWKLYARLATKID